MPVRHQRARRCDRQTHRLVHLRQRTVLDVIAAPDAIRQRLVAQSVIGPIGLRREVEQALARQITHQFAPDGHLRCIQITRETDAEIHEKQRPAVVSGGEPRLFLAEARRRALDDELREGCAASLDRGFRPVIVCRPEVRQVVQSVARGQCPDVVVLAVDEILPDVTVTTVAWIGDSVPPDSTGSQ